MKKSLKKLLIYVAIPLITGGIASLLVRDSAVLYSQMNKPPLAPPAFLFPLVWTILYVLMGVSSFLIGASDSPQKKEALTLYGLQLLVNFIWPVVFFDFMQYLPAFFILLILWYLVWCMIRKFSAILPSAGKLQIPYLIWLTFAVYLNFGIYLLNR